MKPRIQQHAVEVNGYLCKDCTEYRRCKRRQDSELRKACPIANIHIPPGLRIPTIRSGDEVSYYNHEGYADPTAYRAFRNILREERQKKRQAGSVANAAPRSKWREIDR